MLFVKSSIISVLLLCFVDEYISKGYILRFSYGIKKKNFDSVIIFTKIYTKMDISDS